jgi:hypothetical protein
LAAGLLWILSGVPAHANLIINPSFDGSVPSSAQAAFNTAAAVLEGLYAYTGGANTITVNIDVTFAGSCTGNCLGSTTQTLVQTTYSAWRTAMQTDSTANPGNPFLADGIAASLPAGSSPLGSDIVQITQANANVLGLFTPSGGAEATIAFSPDQPYEYTGVATSGDYDFINVAEHEMDETLAIGTALNTGFGLPGYMPEDYFRYASAGVRSALTASATAYFSYNGGVTLGPQFNQNTSGDINDWASGATLVQNAFIDSGVVATYNSGSPEYAVLNTLGYDGVGPEPATWVLMGAGLAGMLFFRQRLAGSKR